MPNYFKDFRSSAQVAEETGLSVRRVQQLTPELVKKGLAKNFGRFVVFHKEVIQAIQPHPPDPGSKKRN